MTEKRKELLGTLVINEFNVGHIFKMKDESVLAALGTFLYKVRKARGAKLKEGQRRIR